MVMVKKEGHKILTFLDHGLHGLHGLLRNGMAVTPDDDLSRMSCIYSSLANVFGRLGAHAATDPVYGAPRLLSVPADPYLKLPLHAGGPSYRAPASLNAALRRSRMVNVALP